MSADTLTATSRAFYERSKMKVALSIVTGAAALMLLGFCASAGGQASAANSVAKSEKSGSDAYDAQQSLQGGYGTIFIFTKSTSCESYMHPFSFSFSLSLLKGFAAFCFIISFILMTSAAIYISPFFFGSNNEVKMIRAPQEIDTGTSESLLLSIRPWFHL